MQARHVSCLGLRVMNRVPQAHLRWKSLGALCWDDFLFGIRNLLDDGEME
jgi:hypothetical protein